MDIKLDPHEFKKFCKKAQKFPVDFDRVFDKGLKDLSGRLLRKVIKKTPVGKSMTGMITKKDKSGEYIKYKRGVNKGQYKLSKAVTHTGGNLRRSWYTTKVMNLPSGKRVFIYNTAPYARYVEYGHRQTPGRFVPAIGKRLKKSWVEGRFMLTKSANEIDLIKEKVLENILNKEIKKVWK